MEEQDVETQFDDTERGVFAALVRLVVRADGGFSPDEREAVQHIADAHGGESFWTLIEEAGESEPAPEAIVARAESVTRKAVQETIYGELYELASQGGSDAGENEVLDRLAAMWNLDISQQSAEPE